VIFAFFRTGSDVSEGWPVAGPSVFDPIAVVVLFGTGSDVSEGWPVAGPSVFDPIAVVVLFGTGSDVSEGSPSAGPAVFPPIVVVALFGAGSGIAEDCAGGRTSDSMLGREFAFSSICPASFGGRAAAVFDPIATFLGFIAGSGLTGARFGSIGVVAAVLRKQPCEVHGCTTPRDGKGQLQPIKATHAAPMRNGLIDRFRAGKIPFPRFQEGDNEVMKTNDENRRPVCRYAVAPSGIALSMVNFSELCLAVAVAHKSGSCPLWIKSGRKKSSLRCLLAPPDANAQNDAAKPDMTR
jgi:hypothetical protein